MHYSNHFRSWGCEASITICESKLIDHRDRTSSTGLVGMLRKLLKSELPVLRRAWDIVSMFSSPDMLRFWLPLLGLPSGLREGLISTPFTLPGLLVGGLVPGPWLETGDRIGDGERLRAEGREVSPARWMLSRELAPPTTPCSDWTTSAKEMKESRRTSAESSEP